MASEPRDTASWYLRMFSYLLMLCGLFGCITGAIVIYQALAESAQGTSSLSLGPLVLGAAALAANGITAGAGVLGRISSRKPERLQALSTIAIAGIVATVLGLGLCYAVSDSLPTSLIFNLLLMSICVVIASNLRKVVAQASSNS